MESSCLYGCAIWGTKLGIAAGRTHARAFQALQARFLKRACGVGPSTPTPIVMAELEARSLRHAYWLRILQSWNDLQLASEEDPYRRLLLDSVKDAISHNVTIGPMRSSWGLDRWALISNFKCDMIEKVDLDGFKKFFLERENMVWANLDPSPRTCCCGMY